MGRGNRHLYHNSLGSIKKFINIQLFAINKDKQARHNENNTTGRSILFGGEISAQEIIDNYAGTGIMVAINKEQVVCDHIIGLYSCGNGEYVPSNRAMIIKSKTGDHVYPVNPNEEVKK